MRKTKGILLLIAALLVCLTVIFVGCDSGNTNSDNSGGSSNNAGNVSNDSGNSSNDSGNKGDAKCSHNWSDATCTAPKTCSKCGETEGEALGHTWVDATCKVAKTCSVCAETDGEALGHTWVDATCETPKTCSVCAETEGEALGHTWVDATCETPKTCSKCGLSEGNVAEHEIYQGFCVKCGYASISIPDALSAPIEDGASIKQLCRDDHMWSSGPNFRIGYNSANGLYLMWAATNTGEKTIKYLTLTIEFCNVFGDPAYDEITKSSSKEIRLIGPIEAGESLYFRQIVGYSSSCSYVAITDMTIEYTDGTVVSGRYGHDTSGVSPYTFYSVPDEKYTTGFLSGN